MQVLAFKRAIVNQRFERLSRSFTSSVDRHADTLIAILRTPPGAK